LNTGQTPKRPFPVELMHPGGTGFGGSDRVVGEFELIRDAVGALVRAITATRPSECLEGEPEPHRGVRLASI